MMALWGLLLLLALAPYSFGEMSTAGPTVNSPASHVPTHRPSASTDATSSDLPPPSQPTQSTGNGGEAGVLTAGSAATASPASSTEPPLTSQVAKSTGQVVKSTSQVAESTSRSSMATAGPVDKETPLSQKPGLIAIICIFLAILLIGAAVILVKCCRARDPGFQKLDEVPMQGKVAEDSPFARSPPK